MEQFYLILSGLFGLFSHYYNRWKQGRTDISFKDYMIGDWAYTIQSLSANVFGSISIYLALPETLDSKLLLGAMYTAYASGFALDSVLNREPSPNKIVKKEVSDEKKKLYDILDDDANL